MTLAIKQQEANINVVHNNRTVNVHVSGKLGEESASELKEQFERLNLKNLDEVSFNFHELTYIGSAGLGKLLLFYKKLSTENIKMRVECPVGTIRDLMHELKLNSLFTIE